MTSLTTCEALQYAVTPNSSQEFEKLSQKFRLGKITTELEAARTVFYSGLLTTAIGGLSLLAFDNPQKSSLIIALGSFVCGMGSAQLFSSARRIQGLWELNKLLTNIQEKGL